MIKYMFSEVEKFPLIVCKVKARPQMLVMAELLEAEQNMTSCAIDWCKELAWACINFTMK